MVGFALSELVRVRRQPSHASPKTDYTREGLQLGTVKTRRDADFWPVDTALNYGLHASRHSLAHLITIGINGLYNLLSDKRFKI